MKTEQLITGLMIFSASLLLAQTTNKAAPGPDKPAVVRIQKTEIVNGVEKTTDTTFTTTDPSSFHTPGGNVEVREIKGKDGTVKKMIIVSDGKGSTSEVVTINEKGETVVKAGGEAIVIDEAMGDEQAVDTKNGQAVVVKKMKVGKGGQDTKENVTITVNEKGEHVIKHGDQTIVLDDETMKQHHDELLKHQGAGEPGKTVIVKTMSCTAGEEGKKGKKEMHITIIKKINITDASQEDMRLLGREAAGTDGKLSVEKMEFYPNPNNGHFNLSFTLPDKGDTEVKVLDIKGQMVFSEKLGNFSGSYNKEIDISKNPKGIYFVRVEQGQHALVKKVVVD